MEPAKSLLLQERSLGARDSFLRQRLRSFEQYILRGLRQRMAAAGDVPGPQAELSYAAPAQRWQELQTQAQEQSREQAELALLMEILRQLQPDHARILSALADGSSYPALQLAALSHFGFSQQAVVATLSSVCKAAGVQCPELSFVFLQQLLQLGLVELDPWPLSGQDMKYEMLETEAYLRAAQDRMRAQGIKSRLLRQSLRLSALGQRLLAVCNPEI